MELLSTILLGTAATLAIVYGVFWVRWDVSFTRSAIKTGSTALLAVIALLWGLPIWALALGLGAVGDWFLSREPERGFMPGLVSFATGHLIYLWLLWPLASHVNLAAAVIFGLSFVGVMAHLWPRLGPLRVAVVVYALISAGLGICAASLPEGFGLLRVGVLAFILSDIILAQDLFVLPPGDRRKPVFARLLWVLYWGGQALILLGAGGLASS